MGAEQLPSVKSAKLPDSSLRLYLSGLNCFWAEVALSLITRFAFIPSAPGQQFYLCPMLAEVDRLETSSWCQCTTGYSKVLFGKAFGCEVSVELLRSVKKGDDICLMKIVPRGPVRF